MKKEEVLRAEKRKREGEKNKLNEETLNKEEKKRSYNKLTNFKCFHFIYNYYFISLRFSSSQFYTY